MFKTKRKLKMYRELTDIIKKIINSNNIADSKLQMIMNTIYEVEIRDNLDIEPLKVTLYYVEENTNEKI